MPDSKSAYAELCTLQRGAGTLASVAALLNWDQETYMPAQGAAFRADQQGALAALVHERKTNRRIGELLSTCESNGMMGKESPQSANVREMRRDYDLATKLPSELVADIARTTSQAQEAWKHARENDDFKSFAPVLDKVLGLMRTKAKCYGVPAGGELYDALLDEYEPGTTEAALVPLFASLRAELAPLVQAAADSSVVVDEAPCKGSFPAEAQRAFAVEVATAMGYDFDAGRLDASTHPFTTSFDPGDVRITWRWEDDDWRPGLFGVMHEAGHGLYEQGLPEAWAGTPVGAAVSLGVHESQSRLWENLVGRSRPFWTWAAPRLAQHLPDRAAYDADAIWPALHTVTPSFIRVEADEATYNLHVAARFEIERALFAGDLDVDELPGRWDDLYDELLGVRPPSVAEGVLQDIHWSMGAFGYFPTYALGSLLAAQLFEAAGAAIGDLDDRLADGDLAPLLDWLRTNVHHLASRYPAPDLIERATGAPLQADALLRHLRATTHAVYGG